MSASCLIAAVQLGIAMAEPVDFGKLRDDLLEVNSWALFGIERPLASSAEGHVARAPDQTAENLIAMAPGLEAKILTRDIADKADMFALWPIDRPTTHLLFCIEGMDEQIGEWPDGKPKLNPSVQSVSLQNGEVKTLLRGMSRCDGVRSTPWGTLLVTEESMDGRVYEIIKPLEIENHTISDRSNGVVVDQQGAPSTHVIQRPAMPTMAWEGFLVLPSGVVIGGDEMRPGDWDYNGDGNRDPGLNGGGIYKFIPLNPHLGGQIETLEQSPLIDGASYVFRASCREVGHKLFNINYGQGCEVGNGSWLRVNPLDARRSAQFAGGTGYYRPEDLHLDPLFSGEGIRFCWSNTGREQAANYGEVICGVDRSPMEADEAMATVIVNRFVEGDNDFNSLDNLAFQPGTGNLYVAEDHPNGDVFVCLPVGGDRDIKSDGCMRVLSVRDQSAEPTGFGFDHSGRYAVLSIQHSDDALMPLVDDYPTDDIVIISGFGLLPGPTSSSQ